MKITFTTPCVTDVVGTLNPTLANVKIDAKKCRHGHEKATARISVTIGNVEIPIGSKFGYKLKKGVFVQKGSSKNELPKTVRDAILAKCKEAIETRKTRKQEKKEHNEARKKTTTEEQETGKDIVTILEDMTEEPATKESEKTEVPVKKDAHVANELPSLGADQVINFKAPIKIKAEKDGKTYIAKATSAFFKGAISVEKSKKEGIAFKASKEIEKKKIDSNFVMQVFRGCSKQITKLMEHNEKQKHHKKH